MGGSINPDNGCNENGRKVSELQELLEVRSKSAVAGDSKTVSCRYD